MVIDTLVLIDDFESPLVSGSVRVLEGVSTEPLCLVFEDWAIDVLMSSVFYARLFVLVCQLHLQPRFIVSTINGPAFGIGERCVAETGSSPWKMVK